MMHRTRSYRANGKVLLSGEYLVLQGALAFAVPLKVGQVLNISEGKSPGCLEWTASDISGVWFQGSFSLTDFEIVKSTDDAIALRLKKMLLAARSLNPDFLKGNSPVDIQTKLEFDRNWGFGSSSSLIALIGMMAEIDAMELHRLVSDGSGYDVACALSSTPVLFRKNDDHSDFIPVAFKPEFIRQLFLVYLGSKQNSEAEVMDFKAIYHNFTPQVSQISEISLQLISANTVEVFMDLLLQHESIMEPVLGKPAVMKLLFPDFKGAVKSLGAWGGDFVLAATSGDEQYVRDYFSRKSLNIVFPFEELLLKETDPVLPVS